MRILYLEDNPHDAGLAQLALKRAFKELQLDMFHKLQDVFIHLKSNTAPQYDLVLTDLNLPDGSGLELLSHIRSKGLPYAVIVVTGQMEQETIISALKAGADDYIIKKENYLEILPSTVESTLQRYTAEALLQKRPIRVLYAENSEADIDLTSKHLQKFAAHIHLDAVRSPRALYQRIAQSPSNIDVVLLDYYFAGLTGVDILKELDSLNNTIPVVIVTGQGSEEIVLQVTRLGAAEYISKEPGYLFRLPSVLENAYHRWRFVQGQVALRTAEEKYQSLVEQIPAAVYSDLPDELATNLFMSPQIEMISGYTAEEWLSNNKLWLKIIHPEDIERVREEHLRSNKAGGSYSIDYRIIAKDGSVVWVRDQATMIRGRDGQPDTWQGILLDISESIQKELALKRQLQELGILHTIAKLGAESNSLDQIIEGATQVIGEMLALDNYGVLLFSEEDQTLYHHSSYRGMPAPKFDVCYKLGQGVTGTVAQTGHPKIVHDVRQDPNYIPTSQSALSELGVPIKSGDKLIGVLNAESAYSNFFSDDDLRLLSTIAGQLATIIERNRLFEEERKRRQESETLQQAAAVVSGSLELEHVLEKILDSVHKVVEFDSATIFLVESDDSLQIKAEIGFDKNGISKNKKITEKNELFQEITNTKQTIILADAQADPRFKNWEETYNTRGWMGIPLVARDEIIGFLTLDNHKPNAYTPSNTSIVESFAYQAAAAISNARLYEQTRQRVKALEVVNKISATLREAVTPENVMLHILDDILNVLNLNAGAIWLYSPNNHSLVQSAAKGWFDKLKITSISRDTEHSSGLFRKSSPTLETQDIEVSPENFPIPVPADWRLCAIPIRTTNEQVGVLFVSCMNHRTMGSEEQNLLTAIAEITGNAIHRADLYQQTKRQVDRLTALRDIDIAISGSFDERVALGILLDHTVSQLKVDAASILLFNQYTQTLEYKAGRGAITPNIQRTNLRLGENIAGQVALKLRPIVIENLLDDSKYNSQLAQDGFVFYCGIPLIAKGMIKGVLEVFKRSPYRPDDSWQEFLEAMGGQAAIAIDNAQLFKNLQRSNLDLSQAYESTLEGWGKALELRDQETKGHTARVTEITEKLARALNVNGQDLTNIRRGALLHDIGKMGIPDSILHKPGPLSDEEKAIMRRHTEYAYNLLSPVEYLRSALDIPYCHHEKWDGSGYPRGLKGKEIPFSARIFAIADVWDALTSNRPYRKAWTKQEVIDYIIGETEKQFDPEIVEKFLQLVAAGEIE